MTRRTLVTGGCGFVGGHLVPALLEAGDDVTVLDVHPEDEAADRHAWVRDPDVTYVQGSVTDESLVTDLVTDDLTHLYHLASLVGVENYVEDPLGVIDVNVQGSRLLFAAAARHDVRVLFTSTSEVFGKNPRVPWSEDDDRVLGPTHLDRWSYSTAKSLCEHMLYALDQARDLDFTVVRYFNIYGPGQAPIFVVPAMVERVVVDGEPPVVFDGGDQTRCFTFVEDAIEATIQAATEDVTRGEVLNVGNDTETTILELAQAILEAADASGMDLEHVEGTEVYDESYEDLQRRVPDVGKAKRLLGWEATTSLEEGLERTIAWWRETGGP